jgi:hypothetical protein
MMYQVAAKCLPKGLKLFANMRGAMKIWASTRPNKEWCYSAGHKHRDAAFPQELASISNFNLKNLSVKPVKCLTFLSLQLF